MISNISFLMILFDEKLFLYVKSKLNNKIISLKEKVFQLKFFFTNRKMAQKTESVLLSSDFYVQRYILSSCMNWNDCIYLRADGSKSSSWKKAQQSKIRIDSGSWQIELGSPNTKDKNLKWEKSQISNLALEETKDSENNVLYVQITFGKNDILAISSHRDFVTLFYLGVIFFADKENEKENVMQNQLIVDKKKEFDSMILSLKQYLNESTNEPIPPVPPLPQNMNFVDPLPKNPT